MVGMVREATPRTDKGEAILAAALEVFGRNGFGDGKVDEIAQLAGVARSGDRILAAIDAIDLQPGDIRAELERLGKDLVGCMAHDEGAAVIRLQLVERPRFPEIIDGDINRNRSIDALAGKLAQLSATGYLRLNDPQRAARQFIALVTEDALVRSGFGSRVLAPEEFDVTVRDGVDTFLTAFR
jgi:hypothetical protein